MDTVDKIMAWQVDLEANTSFHPDYNITIQFVEKDGEWKGMLGPTNFHAGDCGLSLLEFPALLKDADDAFRTAKGLPLQIWYFPEDEDEDEF